jgi:hypothetical protein
MTPLQTSRYWRLWREVQRTARWCTRSGVLVFDHDAWAARSQAHAAVWDAAVALSRREGCGVSADHLRHACHIHATGHDRSSTQLTNRDIDKIWALFKLLANPTDLSARMALDTDIGERRRLVHRIHPAAPTAYIDHLCRDLFGSTTHCWEDLPLDRLRTLASVLAQRTENFHRPIPEAVAAASSHPSLASH